jgi:hypothetical protein
MRRMKIVSTMEKTASLVAEEQLASLQGGGREAAEQFM